MNEDTVKIMKVVVSKVIDVVVKNDVNGEILEHSRFDNPDEAFIKDNIDLACYYENVIAGDSYDSGDGNVYVEPFDDDNEESLIQNIYVYKMDREWFENKEFTNDLNIDNPTFMKGIWENRMRKVVEKSGFFDDEENKAA